MASACFGCTTTCWTRSAAATIRAAPCGSACRANSPRFSRRGSPNCAPTPTPAPPSRWWSRARRRSPPPFVRMRLTLRSSSARAESEPHRIEQWRGQLRWFGRSSDGHAGDRPLPLVVAPQGSLIHEAATGALRAHGRKFDIVCTSSRLRRARRRRRGRSWRHADDRRAGGGGLRPCPDKSLPPLPEVTLLLLARSRTLALASRRWVAGMVETLQSALTARRRLHPALHFVTIRHAARHSIRGNIRRPAEESADADDANRAQTTTRRLGSTRRARDGERREKRTGRFSPSSCAHDSGRFARRRHR